VVRHGNYCATIVTATIPGTMFSFNLHPILHRPLEVIGHDGKAHNVTMEPGDLVLYESHSVIHGVSLDAGGALLLF
jgi:hypothetical protein